MKRILVISEHYRPYINANVNCVEKIINGLKKRGFSVSVMTVAFDEKMPCYEMIDDVSVYRIKITEYYRADKRFFNKDIQNRVLKIGKTVFRRFLYNCIERLKYFKARKLAKKLKKENFDCVISSSNPVFSHYCASWVANKKCKWIMYYLDPFVYNYTGNNRKGKKRIEERWCRKAFAVINTDGIREENEKHSYFPYKNMKQLDIPLPNFELGMPAEDVSKKNEKIIMRYTGRFYTDIRRPDELMKLISKFDPEKFSVEFYGESCNFVKTYHYEIPECLKLMGAVSIERCKELLNTADVLINVGNTCPNQVPSKVFEYVSSGKPILNIYLTDNDPSMKYLKKYPRIINTADGDSVSEKDILDLISTPCINNEMLKEIYKDEISEAVIDKVADFIDNL